MRTRPARAAPGRRGSFCCRSVAWVGLLLGMALAAGCGPAPAERSGGGSVTAAGAPADVVTTPLGVEMIRVPAGSFRMGSAQGSADERPVHPVQVTAFLMDRYEVTQELLARLQLPDPSRVKGPRYPVHQATWTDAALACNERSRAEGLRPCYDETTWACDFAADGYRLPTEAEWEYACRAGADTAYAFGDDTRSLTAYAWFAGNSGKTTHAVGRKAPNRWGFHDLHGNVAEWCNDPYAKDYYAVSPDTDPHGPELGPGAHDRVVRGGAFTSAADRCRSASRAGDPSAPDTCLASEAIGFRCVRRAPATP